MITLLPEAKKFNKDLIADFESVKETVSAVRTIRRNKGIPARDKLDLLIRADEKSYDADLLPVADGRHRQGGWLRRVRRLAGGTQAHRLSA